MADQSLKPQPRATRFKSIFSYYGGKSRIAHLYPEPAHSTIIEPFCGAAAYSALYYDRNVLLYDADPVTAEIWHFLLSPSALEWIEACVPETVAVGQIVDNLLPMSAPEGLWYLLHAEANAGTQGARGVHRQVTKFGAKSWPRIKPKMRYWLPKIQHWRFHHCEYQAIPNWEATWFIDPPYNNEAGARYRTTVQDYSALGSWCKDRWGQVIVCENYGADWLPFEPLVERRGVVSSYQKSKAMEAVWVHENTQEGQIAA